MKKQTPFYENIVLGKLVHGGQCIAESPNGKKIFVWGGLPEEVVHVQTTKKKSSYFEGVVAEVLKPSGDRVAPKEPDVYLSSSPWQIMSFDAENKAKQQILEETFAREHVEGITWGSFSANKQEYGYRNKIEVGFWGDESGVHYASYIRGTHGKQIITSNALAMEPINSAMEPFLACLRDFVSNNSLRAGDLKTVTFRCSQKGEVVAALFIKKEGDCSDFELSKGLKGLAIYYSNPKSPASVPTKLLHTIGDITLTDTVMGNNIMYDVLSFFQVNLPVFEIALGRIDYFSGGMPKIDMYSGVGTIGISVGMTDKLIESDVKNAAMAEKNAAGTDIQVIRAASEAALDYIDDKHALIVDPPRAGLHKDVVDRILEVLPPQVIYLSCNPSTQARDVKLLSTKYRIKAAEGYNFFPRTPHIESLVVLEKK